MSLSTQLTGLGAAFLDFVYPPHCPACEAWQAPGDREALCQNCLEAMLVPLGPRCRRCSAPHKAGQLPWEEARPCPNCAHWPAIAFSRAVVMADFNGPIQAAVHALKFSGIKQIGCFLGHLMATHAEVAPELADLDVLVPVPLHPARHRERGFNQADVIARGAAEALGIPIRADLVRRCRPTRQQARLDAAERIDNLSGAFEPVRCQAADPPWRTIGLIDDVITTGATLSACSVALNQTPSAEIRAIVVASPFRVAPLT